MAEYKYRAPSLCLIHKAELLKQGAEARVYAVPSLLPTSSVFWPPPHGASSSSCSATKPAPTPAILKHRFPKTYRHPVLDASLTRTRLQFEARALLRCARAGVVVPRVLWVDEPGGTLAMERIEGWSVREVLGGGVEGEVEIDAGDEVERDPVDVDNDTTGRETDGKEDYDPLSESEGMAALTRLGITVSDLMTTVGAALARIHATGIIHGDLTTSNMMVRLTPNAAHPYEIVSAQVTLGYGDLWCSIMAHSTTHMPFLRSVILEPHSPQVLIDFGLASQASMPEHFAVDLYVLERAFASTHPASEAMYAGVLEAYARGLGDKKWKPIETKLKEGECARKCLEEESKSACGM